MLEVTRPRGRALIFDWLTPAERRGASVLVLLLVLGAARDLWRARDPGSRPAAPSWIEAIEATKTSEPTPPASAPTPGTAPAEGLLDLNRAGQAELEGLPGVGPVLARRILEYKSRQGRFRSVDELRAVRGVGPRLFSRIGPLVCVQSAAPTRRSRADSTSVAVPSSR